jgi:outer membrane protein
MRNSLIFGVLGVAAIAAAAGAQDTGKGRNPKIGIIDMDRVGTESVVGKGYAQQVAMLQSEIETARTKKETDLKKLDSEINGLQEELEKQQALLSEEAKEKKQADIKRKAREREAFLDDGRAELEKMVQRAENQAKALQNELQQKIRPHMETVAKSQGLDILLDSRSAMALNSDFDISTEVIAKVDETEKANKGAAASAPAKPAPAAKPAAPAPKPTAKK